MRLILTYETVIGLVDIMFLGFKWNKKKMSMAEKKRYSKETVYKNTKIEIWTKEREEA